MTLRTQLLLLFVDGVEIRPTQQSSQEKDGTEEDDYVRQVIEEDRQYQYYDYYDTVDDAVLGQQQQQQKMRNDDNDDTKAKANGGNGERVMTEEERRQAEEERRAQELADRIAAERERKFQSDLARMDEQQKKVALKQKKVDRRKVQSVLQAAKHGDLYGVLGMRNWCIEIPARHINLPGGFHFHIPGLSLKTTTERDIKKQFRSRAIQVHPDKNRDGRAQEAFIAVEYAASILSDKQSRAEYDEERKRINTQTMLARRQLVTTTVTSTLQVTKQIIKGAHIILGPFFTPVLIIGFIIL